MWVTNDPYHDPRWPTLRPRVLDRDQHRCRIRLPGCTSRATQVDHIIDWRDGGAWFDPANCRAACRACNVAQRNQRMAAKVRQQRTTGTVSYPGPSRDW